MAPDDPNNITVTLTPAGRSFVAQPNTSVLESGLGAGIALPYSCANGSCGDCRAKVISGEVEKIRFHDYTLSAAEKLAGVCLLCSNAARSDLTIEVTEATSPEDIPMQSLRAKVCHIDVLQGLTIVRFKLIRGKALRYLPGQYATITLQNQQQICSAIANCPCEPEYLEFHLADKALAAMGIESIESHLRLGHRLEISGPLGRFIVESRIEPDNNNHSVFIAIGDGFAAIKPLVEHVMTMENDAQCSIVWIASNCITQYQHNLCRSWADAFDNINYHALDDICNLTDQGLHDRGLIQSNTNYYVSGNRHDCALVETLLLNAGTPHNNFHIDNTLHHR